MSKPRAASATPFLASQSIPANKQRLDKNVQATGHPAEWFCDDRNVVAPVLASQSLLVGETRLDKNVQATPV